MERRVSLRCAAIKDQQKLNEEARQADFKEAPKPLSTRLNGQARITRSVGLKSGTGGNGESIASTSTDETAGQTPMKKEKKSPGPKLSEYEKQIQANIEDRKKMFEMMVSDAKRDFVEAISLEASTKRRSQVKRKRESTE